MSELCYYICDLETNGLKVGFHEISECSIIRAKDRVQLSRQVRVDNWKNSSLDALKVTGKTIDDLKQGCSKKQLINDVDEFFSRDELTPAHRVLVGHNIINFDRKFLHHLWEQHGKEFPVDLYLDTVPFAKRLAVKMGHVKPKVKLELAMDLFGLKKFGGLHTARGDTRNTYVLWKHLMDSDIEYLDLIKQFPHRKIEPITDEDMDFE